MLALTTQRPKSLTLYKKTREPRRRPRPPMLLSSAHCAEAAEAAAGIAAVESTRNQTRRCPLIVGRKIGIKSPRQAEKRLICFSLPLSCSNGQRSELGAYDWHEMRTLPRPSLPVPPPSPPVRPVSATVPLGTHGVSEAILMSEAVSFLLF